MKIPFTPHFLSRLAGVTALVACVHCAAWNDQVTDACAHDGHSATAEETAICHAYIEGFLDGAVITDTAIIESVSEADSADSDFFKRAYNTRVGSSSSALPATALAHFCLPEGTERAQVVTMIANAIAEYTQSGSDVAQSLYGILKASYPCEE
jgi:hypothetical protein